MWHNLLYNNFLTSSLNKTTKNLHDFLLECHRLINTCLKCLSGKINKLFKEKKKKIPKYLNSIVDKLSNQEMKQNGRFKYFIIF